MKNTTKLLLGISTVAAISLACAAADVQGNRASDVGRLVQSWQPRLLAAGMTADDAKSWTLRNMARFARLNDERLALAQKANSLSELELVLMDAPLGAGSPLNVLMANPPGDIMMMGAHNVTKSSPTSSPAAYAGLVFTALSPCRIFDTRPSQGGTGAWVAASSNLIKIGPYSTAGGGYHTGPGAQGGSATGCGIDALAGPGEVAVIMAAVSTVAQAGPGYLTFYSQGSPNPAPYGVSQWFQPGYVQTSFVMIPSDLSGTVAALGYASAATDVIIDVVGYFAPEPSEAAVTSITAGTGLTGGTITSTGTIAIASAYQLPQACSNGQIPKSNGAGVWSCVTPAVSGGTVTGVGATAPLASSGGTAPNISLTGTVSVANGGTGQTSLAANGVVYGQGGAAVGTAVGTTGQVLAGTAGAPAWTGSPSLSGNLTLVNPSTVSAGNIMKGGNRFIHNFGSQNTFIGENAGNFTMSGFWNTASGAFTLSSNTTGNYNTASGVNALSNNTTGNSNTASGQAALFNNTTGNSNTASGIQALVFNTTGNDNAATGDQALYNNTTGGGNIALGSDAGLNLTTGNFNIDIGNQGVAAEGNTIRIGSGNQTRAFIAGIRGITTANANAVAVLIDSTGQLGTVSSSRRFKERIADMDAASSALMKLRPVTFNYRSDASSTVQYGLIAEEVAEVYPGLVAHSADGQVETVMYQFLPTMLLNEIQKQQRMIDAQTREGIVQRARLAELTQDRDLQTARIAELERERQTLKAAVAKIAELEQQTAHLARLLGEQRNGAVTARLGLK